MMKIKFLDLKPTRLDQFLVSQLENLTRSKIQNLITNGKIKILDEIIFKVAFKLKGSGEIEVINLEQGSNELKPWHFSNLLDVVKETKDYLVINKPSTLSVYPGKGNLEKTLANILIAEVKDLSGDDTRPGIVHRLDKNTSGLMVIAKTKEFYDLISHQFKERQIEKTYIGLVDGHMPSSQGLIDAPIARDEVNRTKMTVANKNGKEALTIFKVIERFDNNDLVEFKILTGRTHQIRVHCQYVNALIHNDPEYGKEVEEGGQFLFAKSLRFNDLEGNEQIFTLDLPEYIAKKTKKLRKI